MNFSERKIIRLQNYDYSKNGAYFVTICAYERQNLFADIMVNDVGADPCVRPSEGGKIIEKWLMKLPDKFEDVIVDCYVIMPDHIHFILFKVSQVGGHMGPPLQKILQWLKTQTTNEYIRCVKNGLLKSFDKQVWQRSYYEHIIRNERELDEIRKYIYENPLKLNSEDYLDY